jgi:hypothetical protein
VEEKARAKDTRARGIERGSSANLVQKKNFQPTISRTRASLMVKLNLMGRTRLHSPTSRRRMTRRKVFVMCAEILIIGLPVALTVMTNVTMGKAVKAVRPSMSSLVTLI